MVHAQTEDLLQHLEAHCAAQPGLPAVPTHVTALRVVRDPATKSSKVSQSVLSRGWNRAALGTLP